MHAMRIECHHSHHHHHDVVAADRIVVRHSNVHQPLAALGQLRGFAKAPSQQPCAELTGIVSGNASIEFVSAPGTASFSSPHHLAQKLVCSWRGFFGRPWTSKVSRRFSFFCSLRSMASKISRRAGTRSFKTLPRSHARSPVSLATSILGCILRAWLVPSSWRPSVSYSTEYGRYISSCSMLINPERILRSEHSCTIGTPFFSS